MSLEACPLPCPLPCPLSVSLLVIETSSTAAFASQASKVTTSACTSRSLGLGGQREVGSAVARTMGGGVSVTVTSAVSDAVAVAMVFGSVDVTTRVTSVVPTGNTPIGVKLFGSLKVTPGALHM